MSNPSPDCKNSYKVYRCEGSSTEKVLYREADLSLTESNKQKARELCIERLGQYNKLDEEYKDQIIGSIQFTNVRPADGSTGRVRLSSSSSSADPSEPCCGSPAQDKGDDSFEMYSEKKLVNQYTRPATEGPPKGNGAEIDRIYYFTHLSVQRHLASALKERAIENTKRYLTYTDTCCQYVASYQQGCTNECYQKLQRRVNATLERIAYWYANDLRQLCKYMTVNFSSICSPVKRAVTLKERTTEYWEVKEYKRVYKTAWKCQKDDDRECCCKKEEECKTCAANTECGDNETCDFSKGTPSSGCCVDGCTDRCEGSDSSDCPEGETCKDGCCWEGNCRYGPWTPPTNEICSGEEFEQIRVLERSTGQEGVNCPEKKRQAVGTKECCETMYKCYSDQDCNGKPVGPEGQELDGVCEEFDPPRQDGLGCCKFPDPNPCQECCKSKYNAEDKNLVTRDYCYSKTPPQELLYIDGSDEGCDSYGEKCTGCAKCVPENGSCTDCCDQYDGVGGTWKYGEAGRQYCRENFAKYGLPGEWVTRIPDREYLERCGILPPNSCTCFRCKYPENPSTTSAIGIFQDSVGLDNDIFKQLIESIKND